MHENNIVKIPFEIFKDPRYYVVKDAGIVTVKRSFQRSIGAVASKNDILTKEEEALALSSDCSSLSHPKGCNNCLLWYCCCNFFIRGQ